MQVHKLVKPLTCVDTKLNLLISIRKDKDNSYLQPDGVFQWSGPKQIRNDHAEKEKDAYFL